MGKLEFDLLPTEQKRALMKQAHRELNEAAPALVMILETIFSLS